MEVLYISTLSSNTLLNKIQEATGSNPGYAIQKFGKLVVKGLIANNVKTTALSVPPIVSSFNKKCIYFGSEEENGIKYKYVPFFNYKGLKHICVFLYIIAFIIKWSFQNKKEKAIICDVLNISSCLATLCATKLTGIKSIGIVTDMPGMTNMEDISYSEMSKKRKLQIKLISKLDAFILISEDSNNIINPSKHPFMIMEAIVDTQMLQFPSLLKRETRDILYAGGLSELYGIGALCRAFMKMQDSDIRLVLFGDGPFVDELKELTKLDARIEYRGVVPNSEVIKAEVQATLLVNPRFTKAEYTRYSFPSKNYEYMASGTPLLTTKLAATPKDYYEFIYTFDNESVSGYFETLTNVLQNNRDVLESKGTEAKKFILSKKSFNVQGLRMKEFIEQL